MLAVLGILMVSVPSTLLAGIFIAAVIFGIVVDMLKVPLFGRLRIS